jgi:hypothetical protein
MAYAFEVIRFRDLLEVTALPGFVPGLTPPTLIVRGSDLSSAETVLINEMPAPEFMIVNKTTIYAQLPEGIDRISTIEVLSSRFTRTIESSKIQFAIGDKTRKVDGILKLVQLFTKWILTSPGSDMFNPSRGGGLQQIVGQVATTREMQPVLASITRAITNTSSQMRTAQLGVPDLPVNERLLSASLLGMDIYEAQMQARAKVLIRSMGGADAVSALVL